MNGLTSEERNALNILCRDDGYTVVNHDLTLLTSNMNSPNFGAITDVLLKSAALVGKELEIEEVPQVTIDKHFSQHNEQATEKQKRQNKTDKNAVYQTLVTLCQTAVDANASDVHVLTSPDSTLFLQRIYGVRRLIKRFHNKNNALNQPLDVGLALIDYIYSTLGSQDIQYTRPANDRFKLPLKVDGEEREFEWRAAMIPTADGPKLTLRCLTPRNKALTLHDMDLPKAYVTTLTSMMHKRQGGIIITGPMGSGKSSLVYALLEEIDRVARNVHSIEDPVEFSQDFVSKTQAQPDIETVAGSGIKLDYAYYCKETLRHDVDISNIGEIRDTATAKEVCRKAETGGLALATLHTNSAIGVPQTLIQQLHMPSAIIGAPDLMAMFVHVKLVRKLCRCAFSYDQHDSKEVIDAYTDTKQLDTLQLKVAQLQKLFSDSKQLGNAKILNPLGCEHCKSNEGTLGEKGRLVVMEMILLDDEDRKFIINEDDLGWKAHLKAKGWPDIRAHCQSRISKGQVDILSASEQVDDLIPVPITELYQALSSSLEEA